MVEGEQPKPKRPQPQPRPGRTTFPCKDCTVVFPTHMALGGHRKIHTRKVVVPAIFPTPTVKRPRTRKEIIGHVINAVQVAPQSKVEEITQERPAEGGEISIEKADELQKNMEEISIEKSAALAKAVTVESTPKEEEEWNPVNRRASGTFRCYSCQG